MRLAGCCWLHCGKQGQLWACFEAQVKVKTQTSWLPLWRFQD